MHSFLSSLLFPQENACHFCERFLEDRGVLCAACQSALASEALAQPLSAHSFAHLFASLSAFRYQGMARQLIHRFKYSADGALAQPLGEAMLRVLAANPALYRRIDLAIPVPLHPDRLRQRGYNQAELLSRAVARPARLAVAANGLQRIHPTDTQVGRSRAQRMQAMRGAFAVPEASAIRDKCILLVDDVITTGATASACASALRQAGAAEIILLTACRA